MKEGLAYSRKLQCEDFGAEPVTTGAETLTVFARTNAAAIQAALDRASELGGGTVTLDEPGTYYVSAQLTGYANTDLCIGAGAVLRVHSTLGSNILVASSVDNFRVTGAGTIVCTSSTVPSFTSVDGLEVSVRIEDANGVALHFAGSGNLPPYRIRSGHGSSSLMTAAVGDGTTNDSEQIQDEIDWLYAKYAGSGGSLLFESGKTYVCNGLLWKPGISFLSDNIFGTFSENVGNFTGAKWLQPSSQTEPMIRNDTSVGTVRGTGIDGASQRYLNGTMAGLSLMSALATAATMTKDCDLLRLHNCWNVTLRNVNFQSSIGFGIRALDCNVLDIQSCYSVRAPWYFESLADAIIAFNSVGGGNGFSRSVIWMQETNCWQNIVVGNFIFNNQSNGTSGQIASGATMSSVDTGTEEFTCTAAHGWVDDVPVMVESTGTVPGGLSASATYYLEVTSTTKFKLATTRANRAAGTYVNITSSGSGTVTFHVGPAANLGITSGAHKNVFSANRIDQAYDNGVVLNGATRNVFDGLVVNASGLGNSTAQSAVVLMNTSTQNVISSGTIDGTQVTSGGNNSKQKYGVNVDASSLPGLRLGGSLEVINHTAGGSEAGAANFTPVTVNPNRIILSPQNFSAMAGSPALTSAGGGRRLVWAFDAASDESIITVLDIPVGWTTVDVTIGWINMGAGAGDVCWSGNVGFFEAGDTLNAADATSLSVTTTTAGAQDVLVDTTDSDKDWSGMAGQKVFLRIIRDADNVADTLANDAGIAYVIIARVN